MTKRLLSRQATKRSPIINPIINGYVAFGDSYAAGIGTGTTQGDGCRQGEFSYPKQLLAATAPGAEFQNLACSGATLKNIYEGGEHSQIDSWDSTNSDVATISIGGNDVGFYDILTACIIRVGGIFAGDCESEIQKARQIMSSYEFQDTIKQTLVQIVQKAKRPGFKLYQTGYPIFFNQDTSSCDDVTFKIWGPHRKSIRFENDGPYLTQQLRAKINELTIILNGFLAERVAAANIALGGGQQIVFVDPNDLFAGHRFCDVDNGVEVLEPSSARLDTWFFLSNWGDNGGGSGLSAAQELELLKGPMPALPDNSTCNNLTTADWGDRIACDVSNIVNTNSAANTEAQLAYVNDVLNYVNGSYEAMEVPWYVFTRTAKTFHPRTLGHTAIMEAVMAAWGDV